jgi:hypothetical protein
MKLSDQTLTILKNFASINPNFKAPAGNMINTVSGGKNVLAKATIAETFPKAFAIYDLGSFISVFGLYDAPEIDIDDSEIKISNGNGSLTHFSLCSDSVFSVKEIKNAPPSVVDVSISAEKFEQISKFAAAISAADISFMGRKGKPIKIIITDKANSGSHKQEFVLEDVADADFLFYLKVSNLNLLPGDYNVSFSEKAISRFENKKLPVEYYIAMEQDSVYQA